MKYAGTVVEGTAECHEQQPAETDVEDRHPSLEGEEDLKPQAQGADGEEEEGNVKGDVLEILAGGGGLGVAVRDACQRGIFDR